MPYNCTLTDDNRHIVEERINELIKLYFDIGARILCDFVLILVFECIAVFVHINTEEDVHQHDVVKILSLSGKGRALVSLLIQVRNAVIHASQRLNASLCDNFAK